MHYHMPIITHDWETFKEGLGRALSILIMPFLPISFVVRGSIHFNSDSPSKKTGLDFSSP